MKKMLLIALLTILTTPVFAQKDLPDYIVGSWTEVNKPQDPDIITFDSNEVSTVERKFTLDKTKDLYCKFHWLGEIRAYTMNPQGEIEHMDLQLNSPQLIHPGPGVSIAECQKAPIVRSWMLHIYAPNRGRLIPDDGPILEKK